MDEQERVELAAWALEKAVDAEAVPGLESGGTAEGTGSTQTRDRQRSVLSDEAD